MDFARHEPSASMQEPAAIRSFLASNICSTDYESIADTSSYLSSFAGIQFGFISVFKNKGFGFRKGHRRLEHIRADQIDDFIISLPVRGSATVVQMGTQIAVETGSFIISPTLKPITMALSPENRDDIFELYHVKISGAMLRSRVPRIDEYCQSPVRIASGAGEIMTSLFKLAIDEGKYLSESQSRLFGSMLVDAVTNCMRHAPELSIFPVNSRQASYAQIREKAELFISSHISSPALNPAMVAEHCRVSVRYLHAAFESASVTLGMLIRETRLEYCRAALRNPDLRHRSIIEIALQWGYNDAAYFSRVYKARYGKTPREDRCWEAVDANTKSALWRNSH